MKIQRIAAAIVLGASLFATGCAGDAAAGGGSKRDDGVGTSSAKVPGDARRVAEATGTRLIHRPLREGTVYVVDVDTSKVLFAGPVRANSNVVIDPAADAVTVNDQQVKVKTKLDSHHTYRLYFKQK